MKKAILLVILLLLPLIPSVNAAGPEPRPWSTYNAVSDITAIAMAREGGAIAAALGLSSARTGSPNPSVPTPPGAPAPCSASTDPGLPAPPPTVGACADLSILDFETGFARNGSFLSATPLGRTHVAVSRDGSAIATIGTDGATPAQQTQHLRYLRIPAGTNWSSGTPYERDVTLPNSADATFVGLAISDDGRRVAILSAEVTNDIREYVVRGYSFASTLDNAFEVRAPGVPRALAAAGDMTRLLVAGQFPEANSTFGGAYVLPFSQGAPMSNYFDRSANGTDATSAAMSRNGMNAVLGTADGKILVFHGGSVATGLPLTLGAAPIGNLTMSEDGLRVAASIGTTLWSIASADMPIATWNATLTGQNVTGLAMNRTGAMLVASTSGTGGAIAAFDDLENTPLWTLPGDSRGVAVSSDGKRLAYAQRSVVGAATIPRALTMDLTSGGKTAPQITLALPGNATYEVTLRNEGAATERVVFEDTAPEVSLTTSPAQVNVRPGTILRVNVTVTVDRPLPGPRVFNITALAVTSGLTDNVTLSIAPKPTLDVKLELNQTDVLAQAGQTSTLLLTIVNNGTSDSAVDLRALQTVSSGPFWDLIVSEQSLTALRGTRTTVKILMTPPVGVLNGTSSTVRFSLEGQDVFDTATVTFRVNPDLKVDVNAAGVTKFIEPGKRGHYNVTVTNTGSLPRQFEVYYTITESNGRSWGVDMQAATIRLDPLAKRIFPVTIIAPGDAQPNERVAVLVSARSLAEQANETQVIDNVTLFGVAVPLKIPTPTTTPRGLPFVEPIAILAVTIFAALLLRRRLQ